MSGSTVNFPTLRPLAALIILGFPNAGLAGDSSPVISESSYTGGEFIMEIGNLGPGATYYIERSTDPSAIIWEEFDFFEGAAPQVSWKDSAAGDHRSAFYRVVSEPYHPAVGEEAVLIGSSHGVAGTARIVNNRTLEISNFSFDGGGIVVQIYLSPNSAFDPFIAVSDDLVGPPFVDETLTLEIPPGTDLDTLNYISVWCVAAGVSFGDGAFSDP